MQKGMEDLMAITSWNEVHIYILAVLPPPPQNLLGTWSNNNLEESRHNMQVFTICRFSVRILGTLCCYFHPRLIGIELMCNRVWWSIWPTAAVECQSNYFNCLCLPSAKCLLWVPRPISHTYLCTFFFCHQPGQCALSLGYYCSLSSLDLWIHI